ncbi:MAG: hypothetical protein KY467_14530 [Gemmatimonadetes bacterium]|nr:hypothetical protein [Gemmatimonadota bacterium]
MLETLNDMEGNPNVIVNFGERDLDNPGLVESPYVNQNGKTVINVWFDFGEISGLNTIPEISQGGGVTEDDVIGHETYGHAQPHHEGWRCTDASGCARDRENVIRRELGHPPRAF